MFIAKGLRPPSVSGYPSGVADPDAPLEYHPLTAADAWTMYFALRDNAENLSTLFEWGLEAANYSLETVKRYCQVHENYEEQRDYVFFSNGQFVGQGAILPHREQKSERQLGIWVDKKLQGRGFATKMVEILENEVFQNRRVKALYYLHDLNNQASAAVARKSLFVPHCTFEQPIKTPFESGNWQCLVKTRELFEFLNKTDRSRFLAGTVSMFP